MGWVFPSQSLQPVTINLRGIRWKFFREVFIPDYLGRLQAQTLISLGGVLSHERGRGGSQELTQRRGDSERTAEPGMPGATRAWKGREQTVA